ncbi:MAG: putative dsRNA-binding protein, partial [Roseimicrobium sp.]
LVMLLWAEELEALRLAPVELNPKGQLQEMLQSGEGGDTPTYRIVSAGGPDHAKSFQAVVVWKGHELATGSGRSKKEAEVAAAQQALLLPTLPKLLEQERAKSLSL